MICDKLCYASPQQLFKLNKRMSPRSLSHFDPIRLLRYSCWFICACLLVMMPKAGQAAAQLLQVCPGTGVQTRGAAYEPGGIILTSFDSASMWVYNIDSNRRYPLPETRPCGTNCRLSRDSRWITYVDSTTDVYAKMRLDGTQRTPLIPYAADVEWWSADTLLVWTPTKDAYLQPETGGDREYLNVESVISVQPGGRWGLVVDQADDTFTRAILNLDTRDAESRVGGYVELGEAKPYYEAAAWSPNGQWFGYAAPGVTDAATGAVGSEIFAVQPSAGSEPVQWTDLNSQYGAVRINGRSGGDLSWSPDSRYLAFWVIPLNGADPETNAGEGQIHVLDIANGTLRSYCDFKTMEHTPSPARLIWSPDSTHLALGGNVPGDDKGYLLLALNIETGVFTALSEGIFPTLGGANPIAWGLAP